MNSGERRQIAVKRKVEDDLNAFFLIYCKCPQTIWIKHKDEVLENMFRCPLESKSVFVQCFHKSTAQILAGKDRDHVAHEIKL